MGIADLGAEERILRWILKKYEQYERLRAGFLCLWWALVNTAINTSPFFVDVTSSSLVDGNQYFGGNCCSHLRGSLHHGINQLLLLLLLLNILYLD
jgi:hypothetical protein